MPVAPFLLNQLEHVRGIEAPHHHLLEAIHGGGVRPPPTIGMEKRNGVQFHAVIFLCKTRGHGKGVQVKRAVRQHHAFGCPRRTAGVKEFAEGVLIEGHNIGPLNAAARQEFLVGGTRFYEAVNRGAGLAQMLDERREIGLVDQKARRGMVKNRREFERA